MWLHSIQQVLSVRHMRNLHIKVLLVMFRITLSIPESCALLLIHQGCLKNETRPYSLRAVIEDVILHEQLIFLWPLHHFSLFGGNSSSDQPMPLFGACSNILIRPPGRFVQKSLTEGLVSFWVLRADATLTCAETSNVFLTVDEWIEPVSRLTTANHNEHVIKYVQNDESPAVVHNSPPSRSVRLDCSTSPSVIRKTITGHIRRIRLSWNLADSNSSTLVPGTSHAKLSGLMHPDSKIIIRVTSRMLFEGNFTNERKRVLCEFFSGFWCDLNTLSTRHRIPLSSNAMCIQAAMRCDGLPDCNPALGFDDPVTLSEDEMNCDEFLGHYSTDSIDRWKGSYNTTFMGQWSSRLSWLVLAPIPFVLFCALVRICSQKRQLDFAEPSNCPKTDSDHKLESSIRSSSVIGKSNYHIIRRRGQYNPVVSLPSVAEVDETEQDQRTEGIGLNSHYLVGDHPPSLEIPIWNRSLPSVYISVDEGPKQQLKRPSRIRNCICWPALRNPDDCSSSSVSSKSSCSQCDLIAEPMRRSRSCGDMVNFQRRHKAFLNQLTLDPLESGTGISSPKTMFENAEHLASEQYYSEDGDVTEFDESYSSLAVRCNDDPEIPTRFTICTSDSSCDRSSPPVRVIQVVATLSAEPEPETYHVETQSFGTPCPRMS